MSDLIDRQDAIYAIDKHIHTFDAIDRNYLDGLRTAMSFLKELPSAQPERKKGKWMEENTRRASYIFKCSCCGKNAYFVHGKGRGRNCENRYCGYDFCPNCGADMRGE